MTEEELVRQLCLLGWHEVDVKLGIRTGFRCEYCGRDMIASVDAIYSWQREHIVPKSRDCNDAENLGNQTVACEHCNVRLKDGFDPQSVAGSNADRAALIAAARAHVAKKRREREIRLAQEREAIMQFYADRER